MGEPRVVVVSNARVRVRRCRAARRGAARRGAAVYVTRPSSSPLRPAASTAPTAGRCPATRRGAGRQRPLARFSLRRRRRASDSAVAAECRFARAKRKRATARTREQPALPVLDRRMRNGLQERRGVAEDGDTSLFVLVHLQVSIDAVLAAGLGRPGPSLREKATAAPDVGSLASFRATSPACRARGASARPPANAGAASGRRKRAGGRLQRAGA